MSGDTCATTTIEVEIQENGIIRDAESGYLIGRLVGGISFEDVICKAWYD
jgi:hypothetical protein